MKLEWSSLHLTNKICWICNGYVACMAFSSASVLSCCVKETLFWSGMRSSAHLLCCVSQAVVFALIHTSSVSIPHPISLSSLGDSHYTGLLQMSHELSSPFQLPLTLNCEEFRGQPRLLGILFILSASTIEKANLWGEQTAPAPASVISAHMGGKANYPLQHHPTWMNSLKCVSCVWLTTCSLKNTADTGAVKLIKKVEGNCIPSAIHM